MALNVGTIKAIITANSSQFVKGIKNAQNSLINFNDKLKSVSSTAMKIGGTLSLSLTAPLTVFGYKGLSALTAFDDGMKQSLAIMGNVSGKLQKEMEQMATKMSETLPISADEAARSYFYLASAGLNAEQSLKALPVVAKFATAGMFSMSEATDLLTDAQSALGLTVKDAIQNQKNMIRLGDLLVKANTLANASVRQFSIALTSDAAASMRSFGMEVEDGIAVLAAYADQGIKAEHAGNMLGRMLRLLDKAIQANGEEFKKLGIKVYDSQGNLRPFEDILADIERALKGMSTEQRNATLEVLGFSALTRKAILPLIGMSKRVRYYRNELKKAGNITDIVAKNQLKSLGSQLTVLKNKFTNLLRILISTATPEIKKFINILSSGIDYIKNMDENTKKWVVRLTALAAILPPVITGLGMMGLAISGINSALLTTPDLLKNTRKAFKLLVAKTPLLLALTAAVGSLYFAWTRIKDLKITKDILGGLNGWVKAIDNFISKLGGIKGIIDNLKAMFLGLEAMIKQAFENTFLKLESIYLKSRLFGGGKTSDIKLANQLEKQMINPLQVFLDTVKKAKFGKMFALNKKPLLPPPVKPDDTGILTYDQIMKIKASKKKLAEKIATPSLAQTQPQYAQAAVKGSMEAYKLEIQRQNTEPINKLVKTSQETAKIMKNFYEYVKKRNAKLADEVFIGSF